MGALSEHAEVLVSIIGALWTLVVVLGAYFLRALRDELREQRVTTAASAASLKESLDKSLEIQANRWEQHENEHREFRAMFLAHEARLSRIEGSQNQINRDTSRRGK